MSEELKPCPFCGGNNLSVEGVTFYWVECNFVSTYDTDFPCCSCVRREKDYYEPER